MHKAVITTFLVVLGMAALTLLFPLSLSTEESKPSIRPQSANASASASSLDTTPNPPRSVSISWVGDLTPGSRYGLPPGNGRGQLSRMVGELRNTDLLIGNLEGTIGSGGPDKCHGGANCYSFQAPPQWREGLRWAGFDLMNLANNHAWDFGKRGQEETIHNLRRAGIHYSGTPGRIVVLKRQGIRVAMVGFAPYPWAAPLLQTQTAQKLIRQATQRADLVVVMIHAGAEGSDQGHTSKGTEWAFGENRGDSRNFSHRMIQAGADLVVGSGPHVVRGMEWYQGKLIAYSTGNFAGWHNFGLGGTLSQSALLRVRLDQTGKMLRGSWIPVWIQEPGYPVIDRYRRSALQANSLSRSDFGSRAALVDSRNQIKLIGG